MEWVMFTWVLITSKCLIMLLDIIKEQGEMYQDGVLAGSANPNNSSLDDQILSDMVIR